MRKVILALVTAGSALAVATPAAAQYYPEPQPNYGNSYAYPTPGVTPPSWGQYPPTNGGIVPPNWYGNWGQVRALQARIDAVQWQIKRLDRRNIIRDDPADRLREESNRIEHRLHQAAHHGGLSPYEASDISNRIARLEQRVQWAASHRYGRYGYGYNNGYYGYDRDRDGRDDRYEDDHGWDHDGN